MANEQIGASVNIEYKSVGEMRKAIKEATGDVLRLQAQFGETSKEAMEAAKRVALMRDRAKEASETIDLFDPGNKFKAFGNAIQGAAGGFAALQGAMGIFGVETKDLEKQLLKVQSALALSQGLSTIADAGKDFARLGSIIKTQVVTAFTTLRGALMATGIGLITGAIAFLIENFDKVRETIYNLFPAAKGLFDNFDRIKQIAFGVGNAILQFITAPIKALIKVFQGDFSGALDAVKKGVEFTKNFREGEQNEIKAQADEREKLRQEELKKQQEANKKKLDEERRAAAERARIRMEAEKAYNEFIEQERERQLKSTMNAYEKDLFELDKKYKAQLTIAKKYGFDTKELERLRLNEFVGIVNEQTAKDKEQLDLRLNNFKDQLPKRAELQTTITANEKANTDARVSFAELEYEQKVMFAQGIGNALGALSDLVGKQTAAGKVLGIAQATINTWIGATEVLRAKSVLPEPFGTISKIANVAAIVASGISAVKNIVKTPVPNGGSASAPSISTGAPLQPALATSVTAQAVNANAINNLGNTAFRAYILNADLQNQTQINEYLKRGSTV